MVRFIHWILSCAIVLGVGGTLGKYTLEMAKAAAHAHQHKQMSYAKFTKALIGAKPRQKQ